MKSMHPFSIVLLLIIIQGSIHGQTQRVSPLGNFFNQLNSQINSTINNAVNTITNSNITLGIRNTTDDRLFNDPITNPITDPDSRTQILNTSELIRMGLLPPFLVNILNNASSSTSNVINTTLTNTTTPINNNITLTNTTSNNSTYGVAGTGVGTGIGIGSGTGTGAEVPTGMPQPTRGSSTGRETGGTAGATTKDPAPVVSGAGTSTGIGPGTNVGTPSLETTTTGINEPTSNPTVITPPAPITTDVSTDSASTSTPTAADSPSTSHSTPISTLCTESNRPLVTSITPTSGIPSTRLTLMGTFRTINATGFCWFITPNLSESSHMTTWMEHDDMSRSMCIIPEMKLISNVTQMMVKIQVHDKSDDSASSLCWSTKGLPITYIPPTPPSPSSASTPSGFSLAAAVWTLVVAMLTSASACCCCPTNKRKKRV